MSDNRPKYTNEDATSDISSLTSDGDSSIHNIDNLHNDHKPERRNGSTASLNRVRTISSQASSALSRVFSIKKTVSRNVASLYGQIKDDNLQTEQEELQRKQTRLGRELTNLGLEEAIKIATYRSTLPKKEQEQAAEKHIEEESTPEKKYPPVDKGYAWVITLAGFLSLFATWGANASYGVLLSYWMNNNTFEGATSMDYAFIGGIVLCLAQSLAPVAQMISAIFGIRVAMSLGTALNLIGFILSSYATKLWQLYCTQGLLVGMGFAISFNPCMTVTPEWFDKKRGFSTGIIVSASGIGGFVFSLSAQKLIDQTGSYKWSIRMIAIISTVLNALCTIITKPRIPRSRLLQWKDIKARLSVLFDFSVLKIWTVHCITMWFCLVISCYLISLFSLSAFCTFIGLSQRDGSHVTAIYNGCQAIGRILIGLGADRFGRVNVSIILTTVVFILVFGMFINTNTYGVVVAYAVFAGLTFGVASTLHQPVLADAVPLELFPAAWSYEQFIVGIFCLFCEVIALKLKTPHAAKPFIRAQIFSGCFAVGGLLFIIPVREYKVRKLIESRLEKTEDMLSQINVGPDSDSEGKEKDHEEANIGKELLFKRRTVYKKLLGSGVKGYCSRVVYPIKV